MSRHWNPCLQRLFSSTGISSPRWSESSRNPNSWCCPVASPPEEFIVTEVGGKKLWLNYNIFSSMARFQLDFFSEFCCYSSIRFLVLGQYKFLFWWKRGRKFISCLHTNWKKNCIERDTWSGFSYSQVPGTIIDWTIEILEFYTDAYSTYWIYCSLE